MLTKPRSKNHARRAIPASPTPVRATDRVPFDGDTMFAFADGGTVWVHFHPVCRSLSLSYPSEYCRIRMWHAAECRKVKVPLTPNGPSHARVFVSVTGLTAWMGRVTARRVATDASVKLARYRNELVPALERHFATTLGEPAMFDFAPASATFTPAPTARETDPEYAELPPPGDSPTKVVVTANQENTGEFKEKHASRPVPSVIPFLNDTITAVADDGGVWVLFTDLCHNMGLDFPSQTTKLTRHGASIERRKITIHMDGQKQARKYLFLSGRGMLAWLMTIRPSRVKPELRGKISRYQTEALDVLERHFFGTTRSTPAVVEPARVPNGFVDVRESAGDIVTDMLNAMLVARRSQLETERRLAGAETDIRGIATRIADVEGAVGDVNRRLSNVEATPVQLQVAPEPWFTVGEYLRRTKRELPEREKIQAGGQLHDKMADLGVSIRRKVSNSGYWQNTYPLPVLKEHFGD